MKGWLAAAWRRGVAHIGTPLTSRPRRRDHLPTLVLASGAIVIAILVVHAFSPAGLSVGELAIHLLTLTASFAFGLVIAGWTILGILQRAAARPTVGHLWLISAAGFSVGFLFADLIEQIPVLTGAAERASQLHGPGSMLLRLLPVWAILTAFVVRSELLRTYEAELASLSRSLRGSGEPPEWHETTTFESGKSRHGFRHADIVCVDAEENYTRLTLRKGKDTTSILLRTTFRSVLTALPRSLFLQVHRSHAVNRGHVSRIERRGRHFRIVLTGIIEVPVSRRRLRGVLAELGRDGQTHPVG